MVEYEMKRDRNISAVQPMGLLFHTVGLLQMEEQDPKLDM